MVNELKPGDIVTLQWSGIGEVSYTINRTEIVPATYQLEINQSHKDMKDQDLYLITCHPVVSTAERMICIVDMNSMGLVIETVIQQNPQANFAWYIAIGFLICGLIVFYFYKGTDRIVLATVLITAILLYFCLFPVDSQIWVDQLGVLNSWMGVT